MPSTIAITEANESWKPMSAVEPGSATQITIAASASGAIASRERSIITASMYASTITSARTVDT
jgi:hypothetical protein